MAFFTLQVREKRSVLPFKRHTRYGCVFLKEVCRTIDSTSVLVLKMLVVCIEARVSMYVEGQTRVSIVPEKNTSRLEGAGLLSFGSKVTEKEKTYFDEW